MNTFMKRVHSERIIELNNWLGEYVYVVTAKTNAERQRDLRERRANEQAAEVRGIYAHLDDHEAIKETAAKINRRRARLMAKRAAP